MTFKQFIDFCYDNGVTDDSEIDYIDFQGEPREVNLVPGDNSTDHFYIG